MNAQEIMNATAEKLGGIGAGFYFDPDTTAAGEKLGLDAFHFYALGRGGVLGDVDPEVIGSAFGYFSQPMVDALWTGAMENAEPRATADAYAEACAVWGRKMFSDLDGLDAFCGAAEKIIEAAPVAGMALYAGWKNQPLVDDLPGRSSQLAAVLRELRGSAHICAVVASGLDPMIAHFMKRPEMLEMFGWTETPDVSDEDPGLAVLAEEMTDRALKSAYSVLSNEEAEAFVSAVNDMAAVLES